MQPKVSEIEFQADSQLTKTHTKKIYSFSTEEKAKLSQIELTKEFLLKTNELMQADVIASTLGRVRQKLTMNHRTLPDIENGRLIVYEPKEQQPKK